MLSVLLYIYIYIFLQSCLCKLLKISQALNRNLQNKINSKILCVRLLGRPSQHFRRTAGMAENPNPPIYWFWAFYPIQVPWLGFGLGHKACLCLPNIFIIGLDIEPKKLSVYGSLVRSVVESVIS